MAKSTRPTGPYVDASRGGGASRETHGGSCARRDFSPRRRRLLGFRLDEVGEIVRMPGIACMPLAPRSLLGLRNFHGSVLPIVDLRRLLGLSEVPLNESARVIVVDRGAPVGFVVDRIDRLFAVPAGTRIR